MKRRPMKRGTVLATIKSGVDKEWMEDIQAGGRGGGGGKAGATSESNLTFATGASSQTNIHSHHGARKYSLSSTIISDDSESSLSGLVPLDS